MSDSNRLFTGTALRFVVFGFGILLAMFSACHSQSTRKPKVAIVTNCTAEFWSIAEAGAKKASQDFEVDVIFRQPVTNTVADQMDIVNDVVRIGVTGVAVSVNKPDEQAPALAAIAKKVNLLAMDNDSPGSNRRAYIGVDNYEAGKAVGRMIKQALPEGGTVALFIGTTASANANERIGGVIDELAGNKDAPRNAGATLGTFKLDGIYTDDANETKAQDKAKDVLEKLRGTPNVVLVGLYAYNPKAILLAARAKGMVGQVKIAAFDEDWTTLKGIADGEILGTIVQDPYNYGYKSVEFLSYLARNEADKVTDLNIPYRLVTKEGGPTEEVNGVRVENIKVMDFEAKLRADLASVNAK